MVYFYSDNYLNEKCYFFDRIGVINYGKSKL